MNRRWRSGNVLFVALLLFAASCGKKGDAVVPPSAEASLEGVTGSPNRVVIDRATTTQLVHRKVTPVVGATGLVTIDPRSLSTISARFDGRIERLYLHYNFQPVRKGDRIMDIYSPQILAEQKRLISLLGREGSDAELVNASKRNLLNLGLTEDQIGDIVSTGKPINPLPIYSLFSGHIHDVESRVSSAQASPSMSAMPSVSSGASTAQRAAASDYATNLASSEISLKEGAYVKTAQALVAVYDGSRAWVILNIARSDAALVQRGDAVTIRPESDRDHPIMAKIDYIEPVLDPASSTLRARVYLSGIMHESSLKIGALVDATITSAAQVGAWLPRSAVVRLGKRDIVFVLHDGRFSATQVQVGVRTDSLVQVRSGIDDTTHVALEAHYFVDSDSFIRTGVAQ